MDIKTSLIKFVTPLRVYIFLFLLTGLLIIGMSKNNDEDEDNYYSRYDDPYFNRYDKLDKYEIKDIYI